MMSRSNQMSCFRVQVSSGRFVQIDGVPESQKQAFAIGDDGTDIVALNWRATIEPLAGCWNEIMVRHVVMDESGAKGSNSCYRKSYKVGNDGDLFLMVGSDGRPCCSFQTRNLRLLLRERFGIMTSDYSDPNGDWTLDFCSYDTGDDDNPGYAYSWMLTDGGATYTNSDGVSVKTPCDDELDGTMSLNVDVEDATWALEVTITADPSSDDQVVFDSCIHLKAGLGADEILNSIQAYLDRHGYNTIFSVIDGFVP